MQAWKLDQGEELRAAPAGGNSAAKRCIIMGDRNAALGDPAEKKGAESRVGWKSAERNGVMLFIHLDADIVATQHLRGKKR